ncbi:hypothetical protein FAZ69_04720 [Trinickia terrae]|uniref:SDR family NAD(P)-dependent oxidoreductase n=1 Tax=Trinickia terrae TaxID=2571161 RepID=A0A4U1IDU0_9BURK|nr:hypothetical protein [Trinickia terrae]TKC91747.1 hypothetical protein FAZ69_04720 [Trinickia terrae]
MQVRDIFSVRDQVVCISGASRSLGKGLARMFAEREARCRELIEMHITCRMEEIAQVVDAGMVKLYSR